jgi:hypothetical protein
MHAKFEMVYKNKEIIRTPLIKWIYVYVVTDTDRKRQN